MLAALAIAFSLQAPPPVTHHFVFHKGGHAIVSVQGTLRTWSIDRSNVITLGDIHRVDTHYAVRLTAINPGSTSITVGCDGGHREVWLVDVR